MPQDLAELKDKVALEVPLAVLVKLGQLALQVLKVLLGVWVSRALWVQAVPQERRGQQETLDRQEPLAKKVSLDLLELKEQLVL